MRIILAMLGGFILDWIFGDPAWLVHPVVIMGKAISALEAFLRKHLPNTPKGERMGGLFLAMTLPVGTLLLTGGICRVLSAVHPALGFAVELLWCMQALAATGLAQESTNVYRELVKGDLPAARKAVSRIVGRDTQALTSEGVTKAAVETVAENASDGVIAPLFYMMLGHDAAGAWRIWKRDRRNHASPNSAQTESACAGALGVQLAGPATYFGKYYDKPTLGDAMRPIEPEDILRANRMMRVASVLGLAAAIVVRGVMGA